MFMMQPAPCACITDIIARQHRNVPLTSTSSSRRSFSSEVSTVDRFIVMLQALALFTRISRRPNVLTAVSTSRLTCSLELTSAATATASQPIDRISSTRLMALLSSCAKFTMIFAPSFAKRKAIALPICPVAPVISTTFSCRRILSSLPFSQGLTIIGHLGWSLLYSNHDLVQIRGVVCSEFAAQFATDIFRQPFRSGVINGQFGNVGARENIAFLTKTNLPGISKLAQLKMWIVHRQQKA